MIETNDFLQKDARAYIYADEIGDVCELASFFLVFERAYNSILIFDRYIGFHRLLNSDMIARDKPNLVRVFEEEVKRFLHFYSQEMTTISAMNKNITDRSEVHELSSRLNELTESTAYRCDNDALYHLLADINLGLLRVCCDTYRRIDSYQSMLTSIGNIYREKLTITKIKFESPGFWEVIGSLNPLLQLREYVNERHARKKDRLFVWEHEKKKGDLEIQKLELENDALYISNTLAKTELVEKVIKQLNDIGCSESDVIRIITSCYNAPLKELDAHIDTGRITGIEIRAADHSKEI